MRRRGLSPARLGAFARRGDLRGNPVPDAGHRARAPPICAAAQMNALAVVGTLEKLGDRAPIRRILRKAFDPGDVSTLSRSWLGCARNTSRLRTADLDLCDMAWPRPGRGDDRRDGSARGSVPGRIVRELEAFYVSGADFPANNEMLCQAAVEGCDQGLLPERRAMRILEVGAGTGSLTRSVLDSIPATASTIPFHRQRLRLPRRGEKNFEPTTAFIDFQSFDIEQDPAEAQGFPSGSASTLMLATNVIHATIGPEEHARAVAERCLADDGLP